MKKIRANVSYNDFTKRPTKETFIIIDALPEIGTKTAGANLHVTKINDVQIDCEQPQEENFEYDYFEIIMKNDFYETFPELVAVKKQELYYIDFNTGVALLEAHTLEDAEKLAIENMTYTGENIDILNSNRDVIETYRWYGYEKTEDDESVAEFGKYGFYGVAEEF